MAETRKIQVAFHPKKPNTTSSDFLVPVRSQSGAVHFIETRSGNDTVYGLAILTGRPISKNELFAKLVESGREIADVDDALILLERFVDGMRKFKIGNIIGMESSAEDRELTVIAKTPSGFVNSQPD